MRASLPTDGQVLTREQTAALNSCRARWAAIRRSTEPADRAAAEEGVRLAYRAAGLTPPARIVWCGSPVELSLLAQPSRADGAGVRSELLTRLRRKVAVRVASAVSPRVQAQVKRMVDPADPLLAAAAEAVVQDAAQEGVSGLTRIRTLRPRSLSGALRALLGRQGFQYDAIGPHELSWLGVCEYFRNVLGLAEETEPLRGLWQVAASAGWLQPHEQTCYLAERPTILRGDAQDRLHDASGPALRFPDGWSVWAWKGVEVPRRIIEQPETITPAAIEAEINVQVRRCMIEIMTPERYVALGGAVRVAEDQAGVLWRRQWLSSDAWAAVEVVNATPEPDGTRRHFFLQVPANIRTPREAVAWTYGLRPEAYAKLVVRT